MSEKTNIKITESSENKVEFELQGQIDEDFEGELISDNKKEIMIFDFNNVTMINSCGVREWITLLGKISTSKIQYKNCPQIVIEQINMVHGFIPPNATIESFYAPYYSENSDKVYKQLLKSKDVIDMKAPKVSVDGEELEFDAIEAQYFQFLKHMS